MNCCVWDVLKVLLHGRQSKSRARVTQLLPAAPTPAPNWEIDNATYLRSFLSSETGQVLMKRARALECSIALAACQGKTEPFRAAGFSDAVNWLESLSSISVSPAAHGENDEPRQSASEMPDTESRITTH